MASFLQNVDLASGVGSVLFSSGSDVDTTANIRVVNRNSVTVMVSVAIVAAPDPSSALADLADSDYIEFNAPVSANDILENTGLVLPPLHHVIVISSSDDVNAVAYGFTQTV